MTQIYHKGEYRSRGSCKHLRPYLKRVGNKRWRKDAAVAVADGLDEGRQAVMQEKRKKNKPVKVKITWTSFGRFTCSSVVKYTSMKVAKQAISRNAVIRVYFYNEE